MNYLERLNRLVTEVNTAKGTKEKKEVLKRYIDIAYLLADIYDPMKRFFVSSSNIKKYKETKFMGPNRIYSHRHETINELLKDLYTRTITGDEALDACNAFKIKNIAYADLLDLVFDKNLRIGLEVKSINEVFPALIQEFNVPLAEDFDEKRLSFDKDLWLISRKLDGVRLLAFIERPNVTFFSRGGNDFTELFSNLKEPILKAWQGFDKVVLDGEACIINAQGIEDFKAISSAIKRKNYVIEAPRFFVFDYYPIKDFLTGTSALSYMAKNMQLIGQNNYINVLPHYPVRNMHEITSRMAILPKEWEGYVLRKNVPTNFKRSYDLMKMKEFNEADYKVIDIEPTTKKIGNEIVNCVGTIIIEHKGTKVGIGSGLTDEQRVSWLTHPDLILNQNITVKYYRESKDKDGNPSLRNAILKCVKGEE